MGRTLGDALRDLGVKVIDSLDAEQVGALVQLLSTESAPKDEPKKIEPVEEKKA